MKNKKHIFIRVDWNLAHGEPEVVVSENISRIKPACDKRLEYWGTSK
jgi:hypothetical protein